MKLARYTSHAIFIAIHLTMTLWATSWVVGDLAPLQPASTTAIIGHYALTAGVTLLFGFVMLVPALMFALVVITILAGIRALIIVPLARKITG